VLTLGSQPALRRSGHRGREPSRNARGDCRPRTLWRTRSGGATAALGSKVNRVIGEIFGCRRSLMPNDLGGQPARPFQRQTAPVLIPRYNFTNVSETQANNWNRQIIDSRSPVSSNFWMLCGRHLSSTDGIAFTERSSSQRSSGLRSAKEWSQPVRPASVLRTIALPISAMMHVH